MKISFSFLTLVLLMCWSQNSYSQWTFAGGVTNPGTSPSISVAGPNLVWVAGGASGTPSVLRSLNGTNFVQLGTSGIDPKALWCIWAVDTLTAFVGNGGDASGQTGGNAQFYRTTNGGTSWVNVGSTGGTVGF